MASKKILVLHGYSQNAAIFSKRMGAIRKACGKNIDFVFVDAPHVLQPADLAGMSSNALNAPEATSQSSDPSEIPRGWWKWNAHRTNAIGVEETLQTLKGVLAKDIYDGVFGFSQGAACAALLSALLERPHLHEPFLIDGKAPHPPMKFCVSISGFKLLDPSWGHLFSPNFLTPTLHVIGTNDVVVVPERSRSLIEVSKNAKVVTHDGGHFVPSKASWRAFFKDYLADPQADITPPAGSEPSSSLLGTPSSSLPASGVATPIEPESRPTDAFAGSSGLTKL